MDIRGLGPALIDQLVDRGLIRSLPDLYRLELDPVAALEHMGTKSARNLLRQIAASKVRELARVLAGLGIRHVGERSARLLAAAFGSIDALKSASEERLARVAGIGPIAAESIHQFLRSAAGRRTIQQLRGFGVAMTAPRRFVPAKDGAELTGRTLVVTGTLPHFRREEIEDLIREFGGAITSSVSGNTDYLIAGENPGSKLNKAKELGIKVLSEQEFLGLIGRSDQSWTS